MPLLPRRPLLAAAAACLLLSACIPPDASADDRLRRALGLDQRTELTESSVQQRLAAWLPVGTPEPELARMARQAGIGGDAFSGYHVADGGRMAVVRFEYDPGTFAVTKSQWVISLHLDADRKLQSIAARRYIAGL